MSITKLKLSDKPAKHFQFFSERKITPIFLLSSIVFDRSIAMRECESQYFNDFSENFLYIFSIKIHSLQRDYISKFRTTFEKYFRAVFKETKINFWFMTSNLNANEIFKILIFLLGGIEVLNHSLSIGNFVALNGYYLLAMQGVSYFMNLGQGYQNAMAAYSRLVEIKKFPSERKGERKLDFIRSIELKNVDYSFGEEKILNNFSQLFERGKIYCITGGNGTGKTTLLNLICGILNPSSGTIEINGIELAELDMVDIRKNLIAVVEQKDFLKNDTLSGGERRKNSIERAFAKNADVLILDEPDNNLDSSNISALIQQLHAGKKNKITIIVSHDECIIKIADETVHVK